jgi:glutathione S-transferase
MELKRIPLLAPGFALLLAACGGGEPGSTPGADSLNVQPPTAETEVIGVGGKFFSVPSPVQAAIAIKEAGLKYQKDLTAPLEKGDAMTARMAQAMMMGVYGADMSYATVHRDAQRALATLETIERLSAKLELNNAFDKALVERFKANMGSEDSLLRFSGMAFRAADQYLKANDALDVSAWVLAGGWVEGMHLTLADPAAAKSPALLARIGEQKGTLDGLLTVVDGINTDGASDALMKGLKELRQEMEAVKTTYVYEAPVTDAAKMTTYINSKSTAEVSAEQLAAIAAKVAALRNMILA